MAQNQQQRKMQDLKQRNEVLTMQLNELQKRSERLEKKYEHCETCKALREGLEFYAKGENYQERGAYKKFTKVGNDRGKHARQVLNDNPQ